MVSPECLAWPVAKVPGHVFLIIKQATSIYTRVVARTQEQQNRGWLCCASFFSSFCIIFVLSHQPKQIHGPAQCQCERGMTHGHRQGEGMIFINNLSQRLYLFLLFSTLKISLLENKNTIQCIKQEIKKTVYCFFLLVPRNNHH